MMVLLKPDHYTAMNTRKRLILSKFIDLRDEIKLLNLIFTIPRHAKSATAWHHRQWIFTLVPELLDLNDEVAQCARTATLHIRNYHAWRYRGWLLDNFIATSQELIHCEYVWTRTWVEQNVSDHSGAHHLARVIAAGGGYNIDEKEHMAWVDGLILQYPGHEVLWYHRRFCFERLFSVPDGHAFVAKAVDTAEKTHQSEPTVVQRQQELAYRYGLWLCFKGQPYPYENVYREKLQQLAPGLKMDGVRF
ncbi:hypothetical protein BX666DRAFT_1969064 [Dichotomocladium elegans]|nr:hypothetical protein BX666DRAFT_1969064 [Dichotomocladium elegans]